MTVVGFYFSKINVEKKNSPKGNINVNNNVAIKGVEKTDLNLGSVKEDGLKFTFEFVSKYDPGIGEISLIGSVLYMADEKTIKSTLKRWKDEKKVPKEIAGAVLNTALSKCNIEAIMLSRDINLPPPVRFPTIGVASKDYIG